MDILKYPLFLVSLLILGNCSKDSAKTEDSPKTQPQAQAQPMAAQSGGFNGTVAETMASGGYTYVQLESGVWLAGPQADIHKGDMVFTEDQGSEMQEFTSKSLNKTFKSIYFVQAILKGGQGHPGAAEDPHAGMGAEHAAAAQAAPILVEKIEVPAGGLTVLDIFTKKDEQAGKEVTLRAKVVKANFGIMKTNWYHLQDGTGSTGTNDLAITSQSKVKVGDIVLVKGILTAGKDFGQGYKYELIIEDATVSLDL